MSGRCLISENTKIGPGNTLWRWLISTVCRRRELSCGRRQSLTKIPQIWGRAWCECSCVCSCSFLLDYNFPRSVDFGFGFLISMQSETSNQYLRVFMCIISVFSGADFISINSADSWKFQPQSLKPCLNWSTISIYMIFVFCWSTFYCYVCMST